MNIRIDPGNVKFTVISVFACVIFPFIYSSTVFALDTCENNSVQGFPCHNVDLFSHVSLDQIRAQRVSDLWGWPDSLTGKEYVLIGHSTGVSVVDISAPETPAYLGLIPSNTPNPNPNKKSHHDWRDIRVYADHAYIVSEADNHGLQVFDLTQLRGLTAGNRTFASTFEHYGFGHSHNIAINSDSGYAFIVGSHSCGAGGLLAFDLSTPQVPTLTDCFFGANYTHDTQCVTYAGPDPDHQGSEICINSNPDQGQIDTGLNTIDIVDVTDKGQPFTISKTRYPFPRYAHQGWLTEDHTYFLFNDELDEFYYGLKTGTLIFDVSNLDKPVYLGRHTGATKATDHNLFVHNGFVFEANYTAGLSVLSTDNISSGKLTEIGFFDVYPQNNSKQIKQGAWGVYPFFNSGAIAVSSINGGLFIVKLGAGRSAVPASARKKTGNNKN